VKSDDEMTIVYFTCGFSQFADGNSLAPPTWKTPYSQPYNCVCELAYEVCEKSNATNVVLTIFFSNNNIVPFKVVPFGSYTPAESLFSVLVAGLKGFNW